MLYYLSMGIYLSFYFLVLRPPAVPVLIQPLNLRYPDPGSSDYIYAYHCIAPVTYPQTYNWKLSLEMPENPPNFDAGVFMVSLALYPPDQLPTEPQSQVRDMFYQHLRGNAGNPSVELQETGNNMRIGSRPLMLRWRPALYRVFQTLVFMVPRMTSDILGLGWFEETQLMEVNMIEKHVASKNATYSSKQCFVVSINNPTVQIYKATVQATVLLEGWRYLLYSWFWTCFFIGSFLIFGGLIIIVSLYLSVVLIMAIIRGQVKFPKLWLSDEEQQMKDMKEAVANLMLQKRSESFLRHGNSDDRLLGSDSSPNRAAFRRRSSKSGSFGELKKSQPSSDRPRSWLDEPIASSSSENTPQAKRGKASKEASGASSPHVAQNRSAAQDITDAESSAVQSAIEDWPARQNRFERDGTQMSPPRANRSQSPGISPPPLPIAAKPATSSSHSATSRKTRFAELASNAPVSPDTSISTISTKDMSVSPSSTTVELDSSEESSEESSIGLDDLLHAPRKLPSSSSSSDDSDYEEALS